ncbi:MAG TPA: opioid growth factor receptor-related protein [Candidatus Cybelea sp.]|nr:opioid growth factor receptor-related protein [Candidatus Cybelea sp.]
MDDGQRIVAFYGGSAPDDRGRILSYIQRFDDGRLEGIHDFIQWLFPLPERSSANPSAPILDDVAIAEFRARPELRSALRRSLDRMLAFYGFMWSGDRIVKAATFSQRSGNWLHAGNHNHLRLTRMLRSLYVLGEQVAARALFDSLSDIYEDERRSGGSRISDRTFQYWKDACSP